MAFKDFVPMEHMNFQMNRVACYGDIACREEDLWEIAADMPEFDPLNWFEQWNKIAIRAEDQGRTMHAAYYHRMSEFFLHGGDPRKLHAYESFQRCFYQAVDASAFERTEVPYEGSSLPMLKLKAANEKGVLLLHGGFDSFIEEFYPEMKRMADCGYSMVIFEGPGQGRALKRGLKMTYEWERPVSAVLDHLGLDQINLIGVSLGGYLALRAAAFEPRIRRVVAYDIIYDFFDVLLAKVPVEMRDQLRRMIEQGQQDEVNALMRAVGQTNDVVAWALEHGMYISGTDSPFGYLEHFMKYSTKDISGRITQDVLLMAGENDHLVPVELYPKQKEALTAARSVTGMLYGQETGMDQHCQVGNPRKAIDDIIAWLESFKD